MTYLQALDYMYDRLPVFHLTGGSAYKPGLDNTIELLSALENPHTQFKSVHIAGTNGKGSVSHFLAAIFQQAGYSTGLYTSPHLVHFGERIRLNGQMIEEDFVVNFIQQNQPLTEKVQPSFFELTMAMAFDYFARKKVDIAIVETGLGGRLDSTNIITPEVSIITNIGMDHTEFLGNTLQKIAREKAGIIKQNVPVVIGESLPETKKVFEAKAAETSSPIIFAEEKYPVELVRTDTTGLIFNFRDKTITAGLTGTYQLKNISAVLAAVDQLRMLGYHLDDDAVSSGIAQVCVLTGLRGRWEQLAINPVIIADTGHNVQGITAVVQQLSHCNARNVRIIIGMVNDKDIDGVLALLPLNAVYYFTNAQVKRALPATDLRMKASGIGLYGNSYPTVEKALAATRNKSFPDDLILITGSNFVVGEALTII